MVRSVFHTHMYTHLYTCTRTCVHTHTHSIEGIHRILVVTSDGVLYVGSIEPREGGECKITKEHR